MSILKKIEKKLETAVEGFFAKGFKSKVEPVEIGKKMALEMLNNKVVTAKKTWAPNDFEIRLSSEDEQQYRAYQHELIHELQDFIVQEATAEGLGMIGRPKITFAADEKLVKGRFHIKANISEDLEQELSKQEKQTDTQLIPIEELPQQISNHYLLLEPAGLRYSLKEGKTLIGRSATNEISVADPSLSRHHFEINVNQDDAFIKDLGSTNGTMVNEAKINSQMLNNDDLIKAGNSQFVYRRENV